MPEHGHRPTRDRIVDAAIDLAERDGWAAVRLHEVAAACNAGLGDIRVHFREKEDIVDAWLDRADAAMLRHVDHGALDGLPPRERVRQQIVVWLEALAAHQRVTRQMLLGRLEPGRLGWQCEAAGRVRRTVLWIREGARLDATGARRAVEEAALTSLFVKTVALWLGDGSLDFRETRSWLDRGLYGLETMARWTPGGRFGGDGPIQREADPSSDAEEAPDPGQA
jgi:AcrR family transcriptional regulator